MKSIKHIGIEKIILALAAGFAAYNFGLAGGVIEGRTFSAGGLVAGVVVNVSLAIAASRYGSLKGDKRTRQAQIAFIAMLCLSPVVVSPVIFYRLPETFGGHWLFRAVWAVAWPLVADLAIVLAGAVSGKGLIALSEGNLRNNEGGHGEFTGSSKSAPVSAVSAERSAPGVRRTKSAVRSSADAVRRDCAALVTQYGCECGWKPDLEVLIKAAEASRNPRACAASAKAGHVKNKHPKAIPAEVAGWPTTPTREGRG